MRTSHSGLLLITSVAAFALGGCKIEPRFRINSQNLTCPSSYLTWTGGLTYSVARGNGDGRFAYAPNNADVTQVIGEYDMKTGDFWQKTTYASNELRKEESLEGYGTLWRDGDLDIVYDWYIGYPDDDVDAYRVREQRFGCDQTRIVSDPTGQTLSVESGDYAKAGAYDYTRVFERAGQEVTATGRLVSDLTYTESADFQRGGTTVSYTRTGDGEGGVAEQFKHVVSGTVTEGSWSIAGPTLTVDFTRKPSSGPGERWLYAIDGSGNGTGSLTYGQQGCTLQFVDGACTRTGCSDSSNGPCQPPFTPSTL